jgi:hypothetical protein
MEHFDKTLTTYLYDTYSNLLIEANIDNITSFVKKYHRQIKEHIELEHILIYYINGTDQYDKNVIDFLESQGADLSVGGYHFMQSALEVNNEDIAQHLLQKGYPHHLANCLWTGVLFEKIIKKNFADAFYFLLNNGADIHYQYDMPLRKSVRCNNYQFVKSLIDHGANVEVFTYQFQQNNERVMDWLEADLDIVKLLVAHGADIHLHHNASLSRAMTNNDYQLMEYFIDQGCDPTTITHSDHDNAKNWLKAKQLKDTIDQTLIIKDIVQTPKHKI